MLEVKTKIEAMVQVFWSKMEGVRRCGVKDLVTRSEVESMKQE